MAATHSAVKLDDQELTLYRELIAIIHDTDQISFKLLGLVPFFAGSASGLLTFVIGEEITNDWTIAAIALAGFAITFGLFVWEKRNIHTCEWYWDKAKKMERQMGFDYLAGRPPKQESFIVGLKYGKTEGELVIYSVAMLVWAIPIVAAFT